MAISLANFVNASLAAAAGHAGNMHDLHSNGLPNRKVRSVAAFLTASPAAARAECATNAILACFWCVIVVCAVGTNAPACKAVLFSTSYEKKVGESGHCCPSIAAPLPFPGKVSLFKRRVEID